MLRSGSLLLAVGICLRSWAWGGITGAFMVRGSDRPVLVPGCFTVAGASDCWRLVVPRLSGGGSLRFVGGGDARTVSLAMRVAVGIAGYLPVTGWVLLGVLVFGTSTTYTAFPAGGSRPGEIAGSDTGLIGMVLRAMLSGAGRAVCVRVAGKFEAKKTAVSRRCGWGR